MGGIRVDIISQFFSTSNLNCCSKGEIETLANQHQAWLVVQHQLDKGNTCCFQINELQSCKGKVRRKYVARKGVDACDEAILVVEKEHCKSSLPRQQLQYSRLFASPQAALPPSEPKNQFLAIFAR